MKKLFSTPKRAVISTLCIVCIVLAIGAGVFAAITHGFIGKPAAEAIALGDAGLSESDVSALRTKLELDDGHFTYEVGFYCGGTEYDYVLLAKNGEIASRDIEGAGSSVAQGGALAQNGNAQTSETSQVPGANANGQQITVEEAKAAALADANVSEADVTFTKQELDRDNGVEVYDISFYTSDTEYDYEIKASDGTIFEKGAEALPASGNSATNPSGNSSNSASDSSGNAGSGNGQDNANDIGVDRAKEIALEHAGFAASDVQFTESRLDYDDGKAEYDIEFLSGGKEYSYTIDAVSGKILEHDVDLESGRASSGTGTQNSGNASSGTGTQNSGNASSSTGTGTGTQITVEEATAAALADANVSEADVTFIKQELDRDNGVVVYDISFYTSDTEYDYEINASDGTIYEKSAEALPNAGNSTSAPSSNSGNSASAPSGNSGNGSTQSDVASFTNYIGVDRAKEIALGNAGLASSDVRFTEARLDYDDGGAVYDVEFYSGGKEYSYTIGAASGNVLEHDVDYDNYVDYDDHDDYDDYDDHDDYDDYDDHD